MQLLRIVAADIAGALPLMKVSDHLTWLAEAITEEVVNQAWAQMSERYGVPPEVAVSGQRGFAVVAYGKLGHRTRLRLGSRSGVPARRRPQQLHRWPQAHRQPPVLPAPGPADPASVQHPHSVRHPLRDRHAAAPSGDSGLLVSSLSAYEQYQQQEAWTWEHQAPVRARPIYGDDTVVAEFARIRRDVLAKERDLPTLAREVREMRQKMRDHLLKAGEGEFDLKAVPGGMVDIEFIAQYLVLAHACGEPDAPPAGQTMCASSMSA